MLNPGSYGNMDESMVKHVIPDVALGRLVVWTLYSSLPHIHTCHII